MFKRNNDNLISEEFLDSIYKRYEQAMEIKRQIQPIWKECYKYALPHKNGLFGNSSYKFDGSIYDSTASSAVEELAGNILAELTPSWSPWFGLSIDNTENNQENKNIQNDEITIGEKDAKQTELQITETTENIIASHFNRSNFYTEAHQFYLDLITIGTAVLKLEPSEIGAASALHFTAIPISRLALFEGQNGIIDTVFYNFTMKETDVIERFKNYHYFDESMIKQAESNRDREVELIEAVIPRITDIGGIHGYYYIIFTKQKDTIFEYGKRAILFSKIIEKSPYICGRWLKIPDEVYGRSPIMKSMPDIKTANKVVELILKNASIAVSGVWMAEDDGILNLNNINLTPGSIIPKAPGSTGLIPLKTGADFDISQLVLNDLRQKINQNLLIYELHNEKEIPMTATEVRKRHERISKILGATYGRLQMEFLTPVIMNALYILKQRGEIQTRFIKGREVNFKYLSPLAKNQAIKDAENVMLWIDSISKLGPDAIKTINKKELSLFMAKTLSVPEKLINYDG